MISQQRIAQDLAAMERITTPSHDLHGINRIAFTKSAREGRAYLMQRMKDAGLTIHTDAFGNVIARREGTDASLPLVLSGSHGDSVPEGGNYDGIVGVLAALESLRSMQEDGFRNECPIGVALFMCEESSRFGAATLGSKAMLGLLSQDDLQTLHDKDGWTLYDVLKERGFDPDGIGAPLIDIANVKAFFECHIEQGVVLEQKHLQLGVVTGIAAPTRYLLHIHGSADHSGATPMDLRHDGLCAAAEVVLAVEAAARQYDDVVGTVGYLTCEPNAMNVIPGEITIGIDIRSVSRSHRKVVERDVRGAIRQIARRRHIAYGLEKTSEDEPVRLRPCVIDFLSGICQEQGRTYQQMMSGAGHDAMHWAGLVPTGMIFLPCQGGISHNPAEHAELSDIVAATQVLEGALKRVSKKEFTFA